MPHLPRAGSRMSGNRTSPEWQPCWECGEPLTPENAPLVEGGIECQSCLTVWAVTAERESVEGEGA